MTDSLTPPEHEHNEAVTVAAQWLANERAPVPGVVPKLQSMFGLTPLEATEAEAMARRFFIIRRAFG